MQFERDTGVKFVPPRNGIERMIDDATGASAGIVEAYLKWFNENVWGE